MTKEDVQQQIFNRWLMNGRWLEKNNRLYEF